MGNGQLGEQSELGRFLWLTILRNDIQAFLAGWMKMGTLTVFDLGNVPHHQCCHWDLEELPISDDSKLLLLLNTTLKTSELLFLAPVIEGRDQHDTDDRQ